MNIQHLPVLKYFSIAENPINVSPGIVDFCLYLNPRIEVWKNSGKSYNLDLDD